MATDSSWRADGWDALVRIGVVVPHADIGPENEISAMAPPEVSVHAGRLYFGAMRPGGLMDPKIPHDPVLAFVAPPAVDEAVELLAAAPLDAIALGFTSSAYKLGVVGEREFMDRMAERSRGIPIVATGPAAVAGLRTLRAERLALIHPPWFDTELDEAGARYFASHGFDLVHHGPAELPSGQRHITPQNLFDHVTSVAGGADAVMIGGNGLRAVGIIDALEAALGIPVLTANQVVFWQALYTIGAQVTVHGYGRLFSVTAPLARGSAA